MGGCGGACGPTLGSLALTLFHGTPDTSTHLDRAVVLSKDNGDSLFMLYQGSHGS